MDPSVADSIRTKIESKWLVDRICAIDESAAGLPYRPFREPVAVAELGEGGNNRILNLDAAYLTSWSRHISYSMRVRLRSMEPLVLAELAAGRALAAQVLLRAHLEASAMASLCLVSLRTRANVDLPLLVSQTLFGTALLKQAKHDERVAEWLSYSAARTTTVAQALSAMHEYNFPGGGPNDISVGYSLLCEASHPNHGGTKHFVASKQLDDAGEDGWAIEYSDSESVPAAILDKLVELLLLSMSGGYGASETLRCVEFVDSDEGFGSFVPEDEGRGIWECFLSKLGPVE